MNNTHTHKWIKPQHIVGACLAMLMSFSAASKDHKIILIHGLQVSQITNKSGSDVVNDGETYWQSYWNNRADERIDWPAYERVEGKIATDYLWPKLKVDWSTARDFTVLLKFVFSKKAKKLMISSP